MPPWLLKATQAVFDDHQHDHPVFKTASFLESGRADGHLTPLVFLQFRSLVFLRKYQILSRSKIFAYVHVVVLYCFSFMYI
jgi:hypothetical protein